MSFSKLILDQNETIRRLNLELDETTQWRNVAEKLATSISKNHNTDRPSESCEICKAIAAYRELKEQTVAAMPNEKADLPPR